MITREAVVAAARSWIGTPWHHQGALKGVGVDCIGLIAGVGAELGMADAAQWLVDPRRMSYAPEPDPQMLLATAAEYLVEIAPETMSLGDIPLLRVGTGKPQHFGILSALDPRHLIHAYPRPDRVVETVFEGKWAHRCARAYRYRALA